MKTLLIDNYDSFTYNLFQLLAEANGEEPIVVRNDARPGRSWRSATSTTSSSRRGRATPTARDFGVCADAIRESEVPLLGVCLGHQGLCCTSGGKVVHAPEAMHGRLSAVTHEDGGSSPASRASSRWCATTRSASRSRCPSELEATAWTSDGILMGVAHRTRPRLGRAVPPRVDLDRVGPQAAGQLPRPDDRARGPAAPLDEPLRSAAERQLVAAAAPAADAAGQAARPRLRHRARLRPPLRRPPHAFWLDSSKVDERSRFSFMGAAAARSARWSATTSPSGG